MKRCVIVICTFCLASGLLTAQTQYWEKLKSPYGGFCSIIPTSSAKVYAYSANGIYSSDDYGVQWNPLNITEIDTVDYSTEELTVGYSGKFYKILSYLDNNSQVTRKLYMSSDEGQTWTLKNGAFELIKIFELPSGVLLGFANSWDYKLYRSTDQGSTWQVVFNTNFSLLLNQYSTNLSITANGKALISSSLDSKMILTQDDGMTWTWASSPLFKGIHYINTNGTLFCFDEIGTTPGFYRSSDQGNNWDFIPFNFGANEYPGSFFQASNDKLLLSTDVSMYESIDDGQTWTTIQNVQASYFAHQIPLANGDILGNSFDALHRSSDLGGTWTFSATGINAATIKALAPLDVNHQYALTGSGIWKTSDAGNNWSRLLADTARSFLHSNSPLALVNADSFAVKMGKDIWATVDAGQSFVQITPPGGLKRGHIFATSDGWLFCTSPEGIMKMDQFSGVWQLSLPGFAIMRLAEHPPTGKWFILTLPNDFSSTQNVLWESADHGLTWNQVQILDWGTSELYELRSDQLNQLYVSGIHDHAIRLAISEDGGGTWTSRIIPNHFRLVEANGLGHLFVNLFDTTTKVFTSVDQGASWYTLPAYNESTIDIIKVSGEGHLYITSYGGLYLRSSKSTESGAYIHTYVQRDADNDCSTPDAQEPLKNWPVTVSGENTFYGTTDANGHCAFYLDTAVYTVSTQVPQAIWWSLCDTVQTVDATQSMGSDTVQIAALPLADCPLMSVNVAAPTLRRCFNNEVYVTYCNQGTEPADSAWVDVMLDEYLSFISSGQPHESLGGNTYRFYVGDLISGDCGQFSLTVYVNCDSTVLGQTHCISAHGFPDTLCTPTPNWSGANIEASVVCQDTLVQFKLENTGQAPSGALEYIIIEDDVVLFTGQKSYAPGESMLLDYDADGSTWRIESMQEPGHPFSHLALAFEEGCGGFESLGFVNQFPVNGISPSWHRVCVENIGSYDPNDKQGFPSGVGEAHNIRPGQELEYLIRFQNTGTDTAFNIVIRDTLSAFLDPASVRPGASSHPYTWSLSGEGVINFMFYNILLPDSNINEPASHGFVQFRIAQQPNLPLGSVIENDAAIYFDFNEPIITNTTWHTLYKDPFTIAIREPVASKQQNLEIWPNPVKDQTQLRLKHPVQGNKHINLYNQLGQIIQSTNFTVQETTLRCQALATGQYWIQVTDAQGKTVGSSALIKE